MLNSFILGNSIESGLRTGLIHRYDFNSSTNDIIGSLSLSQFNGSPSYITGKLGNAARLAATQYLSTSSFSPPSELTFGGWFRGNWTQTAAGRVIGALPDADFISYGADLRMRFNGTYLEASHTRTSESDWNMILMTIDASLAKFYVDGSFIAQASITPPGNSGPMRIYGGESSETSYNADIDEWWLWNRVLSTDEIAELWNSGAGMSMA